MSMTQADMNLMNNVTPSHVEGAHADAIYLGTDLLKQNPGLLNKYFRRYGHTMPTIRKIETLVGSVMRGPSDKPVSSHYEQPRIKHTFTVGEITSSTGGTAIITLSPEDVETITENGQTFVASRPRVKEVFQVSQSSPQFWITAKSADQTQITVKAFDGTAPLDHISEGDVAVITHNYNGEGTDTIAPLRPRFAFYQNPFAISKGQVASTGTALTTRLNLSKAGNNNLLLIGMEDADIINERDKSNIWLVGQTSEGNNLEEYSVVLDHNVSVNGTQGLIPYIEEVGQEYFFDPNNITPEDFYSIAGILQDQNAGISEVLLLQGRLINQAIETQFRAQGIFNYDWVVGLSERMFRDRIKWDKADVSKGGVFFDLGIKGFTLANMTFLQTEAPEFNDTQGLGAIEAYKWTQLVLPIGYANVYEDGRGTKASIMPYFGYEYRAADGYRRENEVWAIGGAGGSGRVGDGRLASVINKSQSWDGARFMIRSEIAPHFALGQNFGIGRPINTSS